MFPSIYRTLYGEVLPLNAFALPELRLFVGILMEAEVQTLSKEGEPLGRTNEVLQKEKLTIEAHAFRTACSVSVRQTFPSKLDRVLQGPLGEIVSDLELRIRIAHAELTEVEAVHDPGRWLREFGSRGLTLREAGERLGVDYSHFSKFMKGEVDLGRRKLEGAAQRMGKVYQVRDQTGAVVPQIVTTKDIQSCILGQRLQLLAFLISGSDNELLRLECIARGFGEQSVMQPLLLSVGQWMLIYPKVQSDAQSFSILSVHEHLDSLDEIAWLFLAIEFGWFEICGHMVALTSRAETVSRINLANLPPHKEMGSSADVSPSRLAYDLVYPRWQSCDEPALHAGQHIGKSFEELLARFRYLGDLLLEDYMLRPVTTEVVSRWKHAILSVASS